MIAQEISEKRASSAKTPLPSGPPSRKRSKMPARSGAAAGPICANTPHAPQAAATDPFIEREKVSRAPRAPRWPRDSVRGRSRDASGEADGGAQGGLRMRIGVCVKQVPDTEARLRVRADGSWIEEEDLPFVLNESDEYALEEAIALAEKNAGEVVVFTLGPARAAEALRKALALGAT